MTPSATALRWMWIWITLAVLVVLVVIGFLFSIAGALESIDDGLGEARSAVVGASGDVKPLPAHIEDVNATLGRVDNALEPIPDQADRIITELGSIRGTLGNVDSSLGSTEGSLNDTSGLLVDTSRALGDVSGTLGDIEGSLNDVSGSLEDTSGSLADTSGTLDQAEAGLDGIRALAARIDRRLELAQNFGSLGTNGIFKRVRFLNGRRGTGPGPGAIAGGRVNRRGLRFVEDDADRINLGLAEVNRHLTSICRDLRLFGALSDGRC